MFGWAGKILRVDLTSEKIWTEPTSKYVPKFLGARGIAAKIAWDELKPGLDAFDGDNLLMMMVGPLNGLPGPGTGRSYIFGNAPQGYPKTWYIRTSLGGRWGSEIKYAGYDGIVVRGKASRPSYLWIGDDEVEVKDAGALWGKDTFTTQRMVKQFHGADAQSIVCGPAGENLVRYAVPQTDTECAGGQGGMGAVMGSKKLKAVAVKGTQEVKAADGERWMKVAEYATNLLNPYKKSELSTEISYEPRYSFPKPDYVKIKRANNPCYGCTLRCGGQFFVDVPGKISPTTNTARVSCAGRSFIARGTTSSRMEKLVGGRDWYNLGVEAGIENAANVSRYGLNQWEVIVGIEMWMQMCKLNGIDLTPDLGFPIEPQDPRFWDTLLRKITYREGIGDLLAEGGPRVVDKIEKGREFLKMVAWGVCEHGAGRGIWEWFPYPHWIAGALFWGTDYRDPYSDVAHKQSGLGQFADPKKRLELAKWLFGTEGAMLPLQEDVKDIEQGGPTPQQEDLAYADKAPMVIWHQNRSVIIGSMVLCDTGFPLTICRLKPDMHGDTSIEAQLFSAATGIEKSERELDATGEMVFNLERCLFVREGRTRKNDETVIPFFKQPDFTKGIPLDEKRFRGLMDQYYALRGWDVATGVPKREKLEQLGLKDVADELDKNGLLPS